MFHTNKIIGISGLEVERVERHGLIQVWAKPSGRPVCKYCQGNELKIKATYLGTKKQVNWKALRGRSKVRVKCPWRA